jgi:ribosomal protein S27AE
MAETKLEESVAAVQEAVVAVAEEVEEQKQVETLEHEIECPRCRDSMTLCSDFDRLYYFCEECDFFLYTIKK